MIGFGAIFHSTAPSAPVRKSVKNLFSCNTARGAPFTASFTTNIPDPCGNSYEEFLIKPTVASLTENVDVPSTCPPFI